MQKNIFILSDQVLHWNFVPDGNKKNIFHEFWGLESSQKLFQFLEEYFVQFIPDFNWHVAGINHNTNEKENLNLCNKAYTHVFATWKSYKEEKSETWRIENIFHIGQSKANLYNDDVRKEVGNSELVIFQDWGLDIRNVDDPLLALCLQNKWVIYRTYPPVFQGKLWSSLQTVIGKQSVLLLRVDDLRHLNTSISKGLSWEQTIENIVNEIYFRRNISLYPLRAAEYVIVSFGCTGSLFFHNSHQNKQEKPEIMFFFDPMGVEGHWEESHPGYLPGDMDLLAALVSKEILFTTDSSPLCFDNAIRAHLLGRRVLLSTGGKVSEPTLQLQSLIDQFDSIYGENRRKEFLPISLDYSLFANIFGNKAQKMNKEWSLLGLTQWDYYTLARKIALTGPINALKGWNIPITQYNYLVTVDRKEMEFLNHLKTLISEYILQRNNQPLSIAVFGSPGSGKSFSIKQLARAIDLKDQEIEEVTFNLSQFNADNPSDLYQAFHVVRDISLSGKIPLVFWDEFDSKDLAWLRYFLAPMQDGEFQEGQLTHSIGKSIFVFAGGTCTCMEQFEEKTKTAISEKGPDFLSRLKSYVNVLGPNPIMPYILQKKVGNETHSENELLCYAKNIDPEYIIRRAVLINSLLFICYRCLFMDGVLQIDDGVLNALLKVPQFKHGTRSMETIFKTSQLFNKQKYNRSDLPPVAQMNLHVNGQQFYELVAEKSKYYPGGEAFYHLVNEIVFDESLVEKMAIGVHAIYTLIFSIEQDRDPFSISREEFLESYSQINQLPESLPSDEVSQNYHKARKIPEKLTAVGLGIGQKEANLLAVDFSPEELETISQLEHIRWVRHHIDSGWQYDPVKQKPIKRHDALVAWDEIERSNAGKVYGDSYTTKMGLAEGLYLSEHYKDLDRLISKAIPWILEIVGYKMIRVKD